MAKEPSSSSHKPRKRRKQSNGGQISPEADHGVTTAAAEPAFPLVAFLWPVKGGTSQWIILPVVLMVVGLFRWTVGLWSYSGFQSPPMHGDFEAQRHWMEITTHLPVSQWYFHDLEWWGLDYPPLTAYHSWISGRLGSLINPTWFALHTSRGLDDNDLKLYMRATVMASEYLIYIPAVIVFLRRFTRLQQVNNWESSIALVAILMQPSTILIDNAHFQYNTVMLGFVVAAISSVLAGRLLWSCVFFVSALTFKQMALYYAPAMFAFLLGTCLFPQVRLVRLFGIALATCTSFALVLAPLVLGAVYESYRDGSSAQLPQPPLLEYVPFDLNTKMWYYPAIIQIAQCVHRVFPFARGLFEDKVANFWCALHTFHKLHRYPTLLLQRASLAMTLAAITPPCLLIWRRPDKTLMPLAMAATAWGFFLFSFQVHEKSVLLPLLPMTLLLGGRDGLKVQTRAWVVFANILGAWTMFPLLKRDLLSVPYFTLTILWAWLMGVFSLLGVTSAPISGSLSILEKLVQGVFYISMVAWHFGEAFIAPPLGKPDTWVVINVLIGAPGFGLCYIWCLWTLYKRSGTPNQQTRASQPARKLK